jgi:phi13 family phage major tail protein
MSMIGVSSSYYAIQTQDNASGLAFTAPVAMPSTKQVDVKYEPDIVKGYADNSLDEVYYGIKMATVDLTVSEILPAAAGELLGQTRQADGMYLNSGNQPPYVAYGYERLKLNGKRRRVWLYKGKFGTPDETNKTKDESVALDPEKIHGEFGYCVFGNKTMRRVADEDDPLITSAYFNNFFNAVLPTADTTAPTVTCVPIDAATSVATSADVVLTFSEAILASSLVVGESFLLQKADGTMVAGSGSWNTAGTVYTFVPTTALTAGASYLTTVTSAVKDLSGNKLAAANTFNFTCTS